MMAFLRSDRMRHPEAIHQDPALRSTRDSLLAAKAWKDLPERRAAALNELASKLNCVAADAVLPELPATTKQEAVRILVERLAASGTIPAGLQEPVVAAVLERESLATTGIGQGIAIPHARHPAVRRMAAALAVAPQGIEFNSVDEEKVHLICLLLSPLDAGTEHLLALQELSRHLANQDYWTWRSPRRHAAENGTAPTH